MRNSFLQEVLNINKRNQSAAVSFHLKNLIDYEVSWLLYLCCLVLQRRRCAFEIACEENLELEEHPDRRTFSVLYIYTVTNGLFSEKCQSLQISNLDLSCVAGKLTLSAGFNLAGHDS